MHVYDSRYPAADTATIFPPDATIEDYREVQRALGLERTVVVQPTTYGLDNSCQIDAASALGDRARLVVVVDEAVSDDQLVELHDVGARGARFQMLPGGALGWSSLEPVAERIAPLGWHVQLQMDGNLLPGRLEQLLRLPTPIVVDHVGRFMPPPPAGSTAFGALLQLLDTGRCWVKLSAPYESIGPTVVGGRPGFPAVTDLVRVLVERHPHRLLWATNWPHPGQTEPMGVDQITDITLDWLPTDDLRRRVLVDNPTTVYGFEPYDLRGGPR
jgi:D-galactarolactone isomerase